LARRIFDERALDAARQAIAQGPPHRGDRDEADPRSLGLGEVVYDYLK
jgi:hypothetical protein